MNTRRLLFALVVASGLGGVSLAATVRPDFSSYEIILQRQPFGRVPAKSVTAAAASQAAAAAGSFIKDLRMCAITENDAGVRVGLIDLKSAPPKSYFLYVGDVEDGIQLVEADFTRERGLLRKGTEEYWISMGAAETGSSASGGGGPVASVTTVAGGASGRRPSYAERLRQRREEEQKRLQELAAQPKVSPEEIEKSLQEYQMDVLRRGEPALPIPLTPEMDDQLVKEGVLPPQQ